MVSKATISAGGPVERAWEIHRDADRTFHGRVQAYLVAQSFLVVAYATVLAAVGKDVRPTIVLALVAATGFAVSHLMGERLARTAGRLSFLKRDYLIRDDVYQNYLTSDKSRENAGYGDRLEKFDEKRESAHPEALRLRYFIEAFWGLALAIALTFFVLGRVTE